MLARSSLGLSVIAAALLASTAAFAVPVVTVDGISIPVGPSFLDTETSFEQLVTGSGQPFGGVFKVQAISSAGNNTYTYGQNSRYLYGVFNGFTTTSVTAPTATTPGTIKLTGGQISYHVANTDNFSASGAGTPGCPLATPPGPTNGSPCQVADFTADQLGTLFLSAVPQVIDNLGNTLTLTIPANNNLVTFAQANALAFLDVTGGDAAANFNTNSKTNTFTGAITDMSFQGTANSESQGSDFGVSGSNDLAANVIPEPATISLIGGGLLAAGWLRRRKAKKA